MEQWREKDGLMSISIAGVAKPYVPYTQKEDAFGFLIIFGKDERVKFEADRNNYSLEVQRVYDESTTYHDGKWMMFELKDTSLFCDIEKAFTN
ncbi:DUF3788 family protein [Paenibacillus rhizoplanae]